MVNPQYSPEKTKPHMGAGESIDKNKEKLRLQEIQKAKLESQKQQEELKNTKWSREDLDAILFKGQYKLLNGADIAAIKEIGNEEIILDKDFGNPRELEADLGHIESLIQRDDIVVIKNGKAEKKERMPPQFIDAVYGVMITNHILSQDFYITTDAARQPILHDNKKPETTERKKQMVALQEVLGGREWQGDSFHTDSRDKSVVIPKITTYITSAAYLLNNGRDIQSYKTQLEKKLNKSGKITQTDIESSSLQAGEKSFLLGWLKPEEQFALKKIQERQKAGVMEIRSNPLFRTEEQKAAEIADRPVGSKAMTAISSLAILGVLATGLMMFGGPKSSTWQRILGFFLTAGGIAFGAPILDNMLKSTGMTAKGREAAIGAPITRDRSFKPLESANMGIDTEGLSGSINRFMARFAGAGDWGEILMKPNIGPKISQYPVGAMLAALNPGANSPYNDYAVDNQQMEEIRATLGKLSTQNGDREKLNQLLKQSFKRHKELHPNIAIEEQKKLTLPDTIQSINKSDGWIDQKLQHLTDMVSTEPEKINALKIFAKHPKEWGELKLEDLYRYFMDKSSNPAIKKLLSRDFGQAKQEIDDINKYLMSSTDRTRDGQKKLRDVFIS